MDFKKVYSFDDLLLVPRYSTIESRREVDLSVSIGKDLTLDLPVVSSPMDTVTEHAMAIAMAKNGGLGIVHRYNTIEEQARIVREIQMKTDKVAAAIGVSGNFLERAHALVSEGTRILCVDVAHGHHVKVERAIKGLKDVFQDSVIVVAGNVATPQAYMDLEAWGADMIRVGIGGGSICSTRIQTGCGMPTFHSVLTCAQVKNNSLLIADGGIKNSGDIVKSLAAGADAVMLGSMLAGTAESPGEILKKVSGKSEKIYRGMASREAQESWRGEARSLEGVSTTIPYKGPLRHILDDIRTNVRSGFSYLGARNQASLRELATFVRQSTGGAQESSTHIMKR